MTGSTDERPTFPWRDEVAARRLAEALQALHLPPHVPGEPPGLVATEAASEAVPGLLADLALVYGVDGWDTRTYLERVVQGALTAWRPDTRLTSTAEVLQVTSATCPLGERAVRDPRTCHACQALHRTLAREALGEAVVDLSFPERIAAGDGTCTMSLKLRPDPR